MNLFFTKKFGSLRVGSSIRMNSKNSSLVTQTKQRKPLIKPIGGFFLVLCGFPGFHSRKFNSNFGTKISSF